MSRNTTNVPSMQAPGNWQSGRGYGAYDWNNNNYWNLMQDLPPSGAPPNVSGTLPVEERVKTGSSGLTSVSVPPYSHMHVLVVDDINPSPGQSIMQDKQKKASNKLRKGIYIPPRRRWRSLNLYYRDNARNILNEKDKKEDDNDYYRCAICLEDFEPRQEVMVSPCSHVFHGECILPWVKSSSRCPVCRFAIPQ
ncbi:hypothetical protein RHSIM_Rhsim04G0080700 [Rhododendron simsii]|uniref:RING-type domain-containing protein n=1 Tax=Rhododendron simsii TaxID=118357 RepID=A0A834H0B3_RHOSS|nr:hypothetical protein RHSIM_Rhsim04G0080700 [Rhododendron simsii]